MNGIESRLIIFLITFFISIAQGFSRVENGDVVAAQDELSRSLALLRLSNGGICSASFLTPKLLVTAGHCTKGSAASSTKVRVKNAQGNWVTRGVAKVVTHPLYKQEPLTGGGVKIKFDVGVVVLQKEFPFSVRPLTIGDVSDFNSENVVVVAGYGRLGSSGGSGTLRQGTMLAIVDKLVNFYGREGLFMVPEDDQSTCPGDSGGAVIQNDGSQSVLLGIHSLSNGCQNSKDTMSLSEIAIGYKSWIQQFDSEVF